MDMELLNAIRGIIKEEIKPLKEDMALMKEDIASIKQEQSVMKQRLDAIEEQTANLTEFKTYVINKLNEISENQKSIFEILGEHDVAIRNLRRRPV